MIALGSDHGGYKLKEEIKKYLDELDIEYKDYGTYSEERTDYPIYAKKVAEAIQNKECDRGILICTTGSGMVITANKFKGIRCAPCTNENAGKQAKEHLNANVISLAGGTINISKAVQIIRAWIGAEFSGERHLERIQMIEKIEEDNMK